MGGGGNTGPEWATIGEIKAKDMVGNQGMGYVMQGTMGRKGHIRERETPIGR